MDRKLGKFNVVLWGIGHTNAHVVRMWKMKPPADSQLICVSNNPIVTYSGMLPGVLAGQYRPEQMQIDLVRLTSAVGSQLIIDDVTGIDRKKRLLLFDRRAPLEYDLLSIGIGSQPSFEGVTLSGTEAFVPVKPMQSFIERLRLRLETCAQRSRRVRVLIVGGGVGSIEIAMCLRSAFLRRNEALTSPLSNTVKILERLDVILCTGGANIGKGLSESCAGKLRKQLKAMAIEVQTSTRVNQISNSYCDTTDNKKITTDLVIWATDAQAIPVLRKLDLPVDERGFLLTLPTLQSTRDKHIFAVGDAGTLNESPTAKAGVFAVRQGPILFENIARSINDQPLIHYVPQRKFLKLVNIGDGTAIAEYGSRSRQGRFWWWLKNRIDSRFVEMYQDYSPAPPMQSDDDLDVSSTPMRCLGCGGKIGGEILSDALASLDQPQHPDVILGLNGSDDAAIIRTYDNQVTATTDFFAAPLTDPYLVGRIAAINSLSDLFVMGSRPTAGLATVQIPEGHPKAQARILRQVMTGASHEFSLASAAIAGGHTIAGPQLLVGFTVLGRQILAPKIKGGLRAGDALILSKPLGSGVLLAAMMQSKLPGEDFVALIDNLLVGNLIALEVARQFDVSAMTDVTGFGFAGHLSEMLLASNKTARLESKRIPLMQGVESLVDQGITSTLADENQAYAQRINIHNLPTNRALRTALFDPQTCGGILFGVAPEQASATLSFLAENGFANSANIGNTVEPDQSGPAVFYT